MSIYTELTKLSTKTLEKIEKEVKVDITGDDRYVKTKKYMFVYKIWEKKLSISDENKGKEKVNNKQKDNIKNKIKPVNSSIKYLYIPYNVGLDNGFLPQKRDAYPIITSTISSSFKLRDYQIKHKNLALEYLNKSGNLILSLFTGYGKTDLSIYIVLKLKLITLYICKNITILTQIKKAIEKISNAKVSIIEPKNYKTNKVNKNNSNNNDIQLKSLELNDREKADIYLVNPINIPKFNISFFSDIGIVVVDEVHQIAAEKLSECLGYLAPRYLLGLSATPYRDDGCQKILDIYFGDNMIVEELKRTHIYHTIFTGKKYVFETQSNGKVNWSNAIEQLSLDEERNNNICKLCNMLKDRCILIFCKRKDHIDILYNILTKKYGESVDRYYGDNKSYNEDCRILICTNGKAGVGFNDPNRDTLILATDIVNYFIQILGRVFRKQDTIPEIYDFVDSHNLLKKHYKEREITSNKVQDEGEIKTYSWSEIFEEKGNNL